MTIEPAHLAALLRGALAANGVDAGRARAFAFARALHVLPPRQLSDLYWTARIALLPTIEELRAFNAAFFSALANSVEPRRLQALSESVGVATAASRRVVMQRGDAMGTPGETQQEQTALNAAVRVAVASSTERLTERDFADLDEREREEMLRLIAQLRVGAEMRASRRRIPRERGDRLDLRATFRSAARTSGELVRRQRAMRRQRVRPLVFLCDVSGSMAPYAGALLQYARANALARPRVRAFAFATRLTDLQPALVRGAQAASMALRRHLRDFGGGTRIGAALRTFNDRYAQSGIARGGTVVILSDGWEREDPNLVRAEMSRLRRLTRRIVWVNPQKKHPAYEPLARGMAAALPYIDAFVTGHNLGTLAAVADAIEGAAGGSR